MTDPTPLRPDDGHPPVLTVRSPEDLLALAVVMLGFVPDDSVAMLTFGGTEAFHARCDLPRDPGDLPLVVESLLEPARRHRVAQAAFVVFGDSEFLARRLAAALRDGCESAGIGLIQVLRADGSRWFPSLGRLRGVPDWGVPYDISAHPFVVEAVLRGQVTHRSRDELARSLRPDPVAQRETATLVAAHPPWRRCDPPPVADLLREGEWVERLVEQHADAGTSPVGGDLARLLRVVQEKRVRDAAWAAIDRPGAARHVVLWTAISRSTPDELLAPVASLLGWAAWQAGNGALAWCAHKLAVGADPGYTMALRLGHALEHAIPPSAWDGPWDWRSGLER